MPEADDVVLPMPCEGAMVFRKVLIPLAGPLDDYPINIGQDSAEFGYVEQTRPAFIAGSFTSAKSDKSRYYLMAKYEMTQLQYKALMDESCPAPSNKLRLPVVSISWLDALQAADKYNRWLRANAAAKLPSEDGAHGFLRLPTETEWEFAARGGLQVSTAEFRDGRYPMPEGLNAYEWFAGAQSANGKLQLSGLLKPNPLGLHDMLGNASEMMFEPFRLNKLDRQHGQAGGYVVRGGNYLTAEGQLRTALRQEEPYYNDQGPVSKKTNGLRLALVSPTLTSRERVNSIEKSWSTLGNDQPSSNPKDKGTVKALEDLASSVEDQGLKDQLKTVENQLRASNQQQQEARDQAIRASLNLGAFLCTKMLDDGQYLDFLQKNYAANCKAGEEDPTCGMRKTKLDEQGDRLHKLSRYYASSLVDAGSLYGQSLLEAQVPVLEGVLSANKNLSELTPYLKTHWANQAAFLKTQKIDINAWLNSCKAVTH
ncbi:SUMF1/EgtB/PvdO family nonheme iron enzyme [Pseudomonas sp. JQ170]|uniref:formylglycine-generating enzyme family protein n=1 Tax=unclassified Pseudomonas TaxID=196821 RepID=UPI00265696CC|nr:MULTISPECIES: SUMF1/EgtB/PvdO family nonheme iron enzyme [unclassified Pseudomonas]MDN7143986.1 SUMF1/EgtB/PvdO family nonheme iron enzyme [Pseudomonas sp. JQ170]WRO78685.1 SUMF1/EgtB/PvdO family nonheme iron enzyme [Pseudomonas sp. 170C]